MNPLLKRFNAERKTFERLRKEAESVRWEYWDWPNWHWEPDSFLGLEPERAKKGEAAYGYGRDKQNRLLVVHEFATTDHPK
jgi:hypothetical protein